MTLHLIYEIVLQVLLNPLGYPFVVMRLTLQGAHCKLNLVNLPLYMLNLKL